MNYKEEIKERQKINKILASKLQTLIESNPTQRFGQILINYFFSNYDALDNMNFKTIVYNEEPAQTLANMKEENEAE